MINQCDFRRVKGSDFRAKNISGENLEKTFKHVEKVFDGCGGLKYHVDGKEVELYRVRVLLVEAFKFL